MDKKYSESRESKRKKPSRPIRMDFRVNQSEYDYIVESSRKAGAKYSDYIRGMVMLGRVISRLSDGDKVLFKEVVQLSNLLSQLIVIARDQGLEESMLYFESFRSRVDDLINRINL